VEPLDGRGGRLDQEGSPTFGRLTAAKEHDGMNEDNNLINLDDRLPARLSIDVVVCELLAMAADAAQKLGASNYEIAATMVQLGTVNRDAESPSDLEAMRYRRVPVAAVRRALSEACAFTLNERLGPL
jgi:hypothetical protein